MATLYTDPRAVTDMTVLNLHDLSQLPLTVTPTTATYTDGAGDFVRFFGTGMSASGEGVPLTHSVTGYVLSLSGILTQKVSGLDLKLGDFENLILLGPSGGPATQSRFWRNDDKIVGGNFNDKLTGLNGNDLVYGQNGDDYVSGGNGNDTMIGGAQDDTLFGGAGTDSLYGGSGVDELSGGDADDVLLGGTGDDELEGQGGKDSLKGDAGDDTLSGGALADVLDGGSGFDRLYGNTGHDTLVGGAGTDVISGGSGSDVFEFRALSEGYRSLYHSDLIADFRHAIDKIDVSAIDARSTPAGNQAFKFLGTAEFTRHEGEARYTLSGSTTYVFFDVNGDGQTDMTISISGKVTLASSDFVL